MAPPFCAHKIKQKMYIKVNERRHSWLILFYNVRRDQMPIKHLSLSTHKEHEVHNNSKAMNVWFKYQSIACSSPALSLNFIYLKGVIIFQK